MNDLQKILVFFAIVLFVLLGVGALFLLFSGFATTSSYGETIAVIPMKGEISGDGPLSDQGISASAMTSLFDEARNDPDVVAVVLEIDSGGGGVVESKEIARSLKQLSDTKPVVAYIGDVGASGAYYVASYAELIVSDEDSIVGSIGVISTHTVYKNLFEDKLGINVTVIKSGKFKDIGSPYRAMDSEEKERFQQMVDQIHEEFIGVITKNRALGQAELKEIETSGIFLGSEALKIGLVDQNGGLLDAIASARSLADSPEAQPHYVDDPSELESDPFYNLGLGMGDAFSSNLKTSDWDLKLK